MADSLPSGYPDWAHRLDELGITDARIVFQYSLTNSCELTEITVREISSREFFDPDTVQSVVASFVGPFDASNFDTASAEPGRVASLSMTKRLIRWSTDFGHNYIVCRFTVRGTFADAYLTDGHFPPSISIADEPIRVPLSSLGPKLKTITFTWADGETVKWDEGDT